MKQIVLIHGGTTFDSYEEYLRELAAFSPDISEFLPKDRWRNTLGAVLGADFQVLVPAMPNKENARYAEWKLWFEKVIPFMEDGVVLVGHSLGGIFLAKYLSENILPVSIRALILIAAPYDDEGMPESLGDFRLSQPVAEMGKQVQDIYLLHSRDDMVVPFDHAQKYVNDLPQTKVMAFDGKGHINQPEFPELVELVRKVLASQ